MSEGSHERETSAEDILWDKMVARVTGAICSAGQSTCPMHRDIAKRYARHFFRALHAEGYAARKVRGVEGESLDELLAAAGAPSTGYASPHANEEV